jgi:hypothetical protein
METGIDWQAIKNELDNTEWETTEPGRYERVIFLGTVFSLMPSGKYATSFANSNMSEEEMELDSEFYQALEEEAGEHGLFITSGEDPCDIIVGEWTEDRP